MRKQQQIWYEEHTQKGTLPTMANSEPASGVILFTDYLKDRAIPFVGQAVDIGAGKGRNSVHLAKLGFTVTGLEYIQSALDAAQLLAQSGNVAGQIHFNLAEIDKTWNLPDNYFDIAVDSFSSIDIETLEGREICRDEMLRTLKPEGYALVTVCSAEDEWEKELIARYPGPEPNSTFWPQNGKFQKDYNKEELRHFYRIFDILELREIKKPAFKLGRKGTATNLSLILQKPKSQI